jgi:hypothetical protein
MHATGSIYAHPFRNSFILIIQNPPKDVTADCKRVFKSITSISRYRQVHFAAVKRGLYTVSSFYFVN